MTLVAKSPAAEAVNTAEFAALSAVATARAQAQVNGPAYRAKGAALAELALAEARGQGTVWTRFYRNMLELESEGRAEFRTVIGKHKRAQSAIVKANSEEDKTNESYAGASRSAMVRLSELNTISKALDVGVEFDKDWPFHYAVGHARAVLNSKGAGDKRGRKEKPWQEKVKEYLSKNVPFGEMYELVAIVEEMAKAGKE